MILLIVSLGLFQTMKKRAKEKGGDAEVVKLMRLFSSTLVGILVNCCSCCWSMLNVVHAVLCINQKQTTGKAAATMYNYMVNFRKSYYLCITFNEPMDHTIIILLCKFLEFGSLLVLVQQEHCETL